MDRYPNHLKQTKRDSINILSCCIKFVDWSFVSPVILTKEKHVTEIYFEHFQKRIIINFLEINKTPMKV